jgi:hypothetical protein
MIRAALLLVTLVLGACAAEGGPDAQQRLQNEQMRPVPPAGPQAITR